MLERGAVAGLNHLLSRQPSAASRLRPFAGQTVEVRCPPFPDLRLTILESGLLDRAQGESASALVVKLKLGAVPLLLARDEAARGQIEIEGPADLADAVDALFRNLAWDIEEDLSTVFGDVVAHRLASGGKAFAAWQREAVLRLAENLAEYWVEEQPLLVRPDDAGKFGREVEALRDETARLEKRIERLESPGKR
jgi:ubiquinone biosynthesis protein UbiJ